MIDKAESPEATGKPGIHVAGLIGALSLVFFHPGAMDMDRLKGNLLLVAMLPLCAILFGPGRLLRAICRPLHHALTCALVLCALLVLSFFANFSLHTDGLGMVARLLGIVVLAMLVRDTARSHPRVVPAWLIGGGMITAGYAVLQSAGFEPFYLSNPQHDPVSFLGNTNELAEVMALLIPLCMALVFDSRKACLTGALVGLPLMVAALWVSGGRGGMLATLCGASLFLILLARSRKNVSHDVIDPASHVVAKGKRFGMMLGAMAAGLLVALAVGSEQHLIMKKIESDESIFSADYPTNRARIEVWKSTISMIQDSPVLGAGPARFRMAYPPYRSAVEAQLPGLMGARTEVLDPHNEYLWAGAEAGVPGAIVFLLFCFFLVRSGLKAAARSTREEGSLLEAGMAGSMLAFAMLCLFRSPVHNPAATTITFLIAGHLLCGMGAAGSSVLRVSPKRKWIAVSGLAMVTVLSLWIGGRGIASDWTAASTAMREEIGKEEFTAFQRAADLDPSNIDIINFVGQVAANRLMGTSADKDLRYTREAEKRLKQVLELHPHHPGALKSLARVSIELGDQAGALDLLRRYHEATHEAGTPEGTLSELLIDTGRLREAAEVQVKGSTEDAGLILEQANALFDKGDVEAALIYVDKYLIQNPLDGDAHYLQGRCLKTLYDEGHDDAYQRMHISYALSWIEQGDWEQAGGSVQRSIRYGEGSGEAFLLAAIIDAAAGKPFEYKARLPENEPFKAKLRQLASEEQLPESVIIYLNKMD